MTTEQAEASHRAPGALRASVVVVNKDDERVTATLDRLAAIDAEQLAEVLVIDASEHRLDHVRSSFPSVTWIDFENTAQRPRTIADQRNEGVRRSTGNVIVFLDANCMPAPQWLEELLEPIATGTESIVAGRIESLEPDSIHDRASNQGSSIVTTLDECACMNVAFHRDVFETVGLFDESLGYAEDFDLAWRARDAGFSIRYNPAATVFHHFGDFREDLPRAFRYGVGRVRLYRKHPQRLTRLIDRDRYIAAYGLFLIFLPVVLVFPAYVLLLAYPLLRNRRSRPFRTVTYHLVYALGVLSEVAQVRIGPGRRRAR